MTSAQLHWQARRYLMDRYDELTSRYNALPDQGRAGFGYTAEAKRIFPRYRVVEAMLTEIERLDPDHLPDPGPLAAELATAAATANSPFTRPPMGQVELDAIRAERERFDAAVRSWAGTADLQVEPLPYRRVLRPDESACWLREVAARWGVRGLHWHPMITAEVPNDVLVLEEESMWDGPGLSLVREALAGLGRTRAVELREGGTDHLLDVGLLETRYTGDEGVFTDDTLDWIAYASHEGTVAFGGTLAERLRTTWPDPPLWS